MDWDNLTRGKPKQEASLTNEIEIMRASDHPNIVRLYDVVREGCMIHLVMEYCGGGTLEDFIKTQGPLPEDESRHFVRQLGISRPPYVCSLIRVLTFHAQRSASSSCGTRGSFIAT